MKKNLIIVLFIFLVPLIAYFMLSSFGGSNVANADSQTSKPQIVKFTSVMCMDCQTMNKIIKEIYPKYKDCIELMEINVQDNNPKNDEWIKKYDVTLVPTIILVNSSGNQVKRIEGAIEKEQMEKYLQDLK